MEKNFEKIKNYLSENKILIIGLLFLSTILINIGFESYQQDFSACSAAIHSYWKGFNPYLNNASHGDLFNDSNFSGYFSRFVYPPVAIFFFLPLFFLNSYLISKLIFTFISVAALISLFLLLNNKFKIDDKFIFLMFISIPVITNIERGQIYIILSLLLTLTYLTRKSLFSGLFLSMAIYLRMFPILLIPYLLLKKEYKLALSSICFSSLFFLFSLKAINPKAWIYFIHNLFSQSKNYGINIISNFYNNDYSIITPDFTYLYNHFGFFNTSGQFFITQLLPTSSLKMLFGALIVLIFLFITKKEKFNFLDYNIFLYLILILNINNLNIYNMVLYIPIAFIFLNRYKDSFGFILLTLLPLFNPSQLGFKIGPGYSYLLGIITLALYQFFIRQKQAKKAN